MSGRGRNAGGEGNWRPADVDRVMHEPVRLAVMGILCSDSGYRADYTFLKTALGATDGNLASHLRVLEEAGYVRAKKQFIGRRPNTMYAATANGKRAYEAYRHVMLELLQPWTGKAMPKADDNPG